MFLCEVGMNNTLVGLLHPQADEKMFNFSKCSTPAPFLSFIFPLWLYVRLSGVFVSFRESGVDLLFSCLQWAQSARSASQTKGSLCICKHKRINRQNELGVVPLSDAARVLQLYNLVGRLFTRCSIHWQSKRRQMGHKPPPTWSGWVSFSSAWRSFRRATCDSCCDWRSPVRLVWLTRLIMGDGSRMRAMIRDLRAAAWHTWSAKGWRELGGVWHLMLSICVCTADKWWIEHMPACTPTGLTSCLLSPASFSFELLPAITHTQTHKRYLNPER